MNTRSLRLPAVLTLICGVCAAAFAQSAVRAATSRPSSRAARAAATRPASAPTTQAGLPEQEYAAILLDGKKAGYAVETRTEANGIVTTSQTMKITLSRGKIALSVATAETAVETADGKPISFKSVQDMGIMATTIEGMIDAAGKLKVKTVSGGSTRNQEMDWPKGALLSEGLRLLSLEKGLTEGTSYSAQVFDTSSLRAMEAHIKVGAKANVDLFGRVVKLTQVTTVMAGAMGDLTAITYVDENMDALKSVAPALGMNLEILACTKEFALSPNDATDFFDKLLIHSPIPLKDLKAGQPVRYTIQPTGKGILKFITTDEQTVRAGSAGSVLLTVRPIPLAKGEEFPYAGHDASLLQSLKPTAFLQCDDKLVKDLARQAVGDAKDSAQAARRIEAFVAKYIEKKDLSVGYASAAEVAQSREGDCTEHAVLVAAFCRAVGIPSQVVVGVAYVSSFGGQKDIFGPHAWARAWVGGKWVSLDAALGGFDAGHITMAYGNGDPEDFFGLVNLLGNIKIVQVQLVPGARATTGPAAE